MQGTLTEGEGSVRFLIKVACFVKKSIIFSLSKTANLNYKEVNCSEPYPSVRVSYLHD